MRRLVQVVPTVLAIAILNFIIIRLAPGDPALYIVGSSQGTAEYYELLRKQFGLDEPIVVQLGLYLWNLLRFDLGYSFVQQAPVLDAILARLPATLLLMGTAFVVASLAGILLGIVAAFRSNTLGDRVAVMAALAGYSIPIFWLGQLLVMLFALHLDWLPSQGIRSLRDPKEGWEGVLDVGRHLILPATTYAVFHLALVFRLMRTKMQDVLVQDYILLHHAMLNALLPVVTVLGINFGFMLAGSVLTETVFSWPGMGRLVFESVSSRDYPMISGIFIFVSVMVILVNLLTDLIYAWIDPRVYLR